MEPRQYSPHEGRAPQPPPSSSRGWTAHSSPGGRRGRPGGRGAVARNSPAGDDLEGRGPQHGTTTNRHRPQGGSMQQTLTMAAARAVDATKVYGSADTAVRALDEVSVGFPQGRFTAIMGPSGSGKSTLMHCLAGLDQLSSGEVYLGEVELASCRRSPPRRTSPSRCCSQASGPIRTGSTPSSPRSALATAWPTGHPSCRVASSSGSPSPGPSSPGHRSSSPTSPPATSTLARVPNCSVSCGGRCGRSARRS